MGIFSYVLAVRALDNINQIVKSNVILEETQYVLSFWNPCFYYNIAFKQVMFIFGSRVLVP